jgi:hypothetical protein
VPPRLIWTAGTLPGMSGAQLGTLLPVLPVQASCSYPPHDMMLTWADGYVGWSRLDSPAMTVQRNARHSESDNWRNGPSGSLESLTNTVLPEKATSTQPDSVQRVLRRQTREQPPWSGRAIVSFQGNSKGWTGVMFCSSVQNVTLLTGPFVRDGRAVICPGRQNVPERRCPEAPAMP